MARATYGGTTSDFVYTLAAGGLMRVSAATIYLWTAETGGSQVTDLLLAGNPITTIPVGTDGQIPDFSGPDSVYELWASVGASGVRVKMLPVTQDLLSATYATRPRNTPPIWTTYGDSLAKAANPAVVAIGDSITDNNHTATAWTGASASRTAAYRADGYLTRAMIELRQPFSVFDVGISGQTAADGLARFDADVTPLRPHVVIEAFGSNDIVSSRTAAATFADKKAMWEKAWRSGAKVITMNVPPRNTFTTAQKQEAQRLNDLLSRFAAANPRDFALVDWYSVLADPLTDAYRAGVQTDGVHPNTLGALNVAPIVAAALRRFLPDTPGPLPTKNVNDVTNLVASPLLIGNAGGKNAPMTGEIATNWFGVTTATGATASKVARADGFGDWQQVAITGSGTTTVFGAVSGWAVGDVVRAVCEFETDASGWADGGITVKVQCLDGATIYHSASAQSEGSDATTLGRQTSGVLMTPPIVVPAGTVTLRVDLEKKNAGTVRFGRVALRKLPLT